MPLAKILACKCNDVKGDLARQAVWGMGYRKDGLSSNSHVIL